MNLDGGLEPGYKIRIWFSGWGFQLALVEFFPELLGWNTVLAPEKLDEIGIRFKPAILRDPKYRKPGRLE